MIEFTLRLSKSNVSVRNFLWRLRQYGRIIDYRDLATLVIAIERDQDHRQHTDTAHTATKEAAIVAAM